MSAKEVVNKYINYLSIQMKYLFVSALMVGIGIIGDHVLALKRTSFNSYLIAFTDTLIHGVIAFFSWILVYVFKEQPICESMLLLEAVLCGITASAIDLDHVIAAKSFDIKIIGQLTDRPFLHNTTLTSLISMAIISLSLIRHNWMSFTYGWIFLTASLSHHTRDAIRRGFWFYPFHTKPLPFWLYVLLLTSYPMICSVVMDIVAKQWLDRYSDHNFRYKTVNLEIEEV